MQASSFRLPKLRQVSLLRLDPNYLMFILLVFQLFVNLLTPLSHFILIAFLGFIIDFSSFFKIFYFILVFLHSQTNLERKMIYESHTSQSNLTLLC